MSDFAAFARAHGLIVDGIDAGRWVRVPTVDHPRKKNGAYKFLGDIGWAKAAERAQAMVSGAALATHGYLSCKGFGDMPGLVLSDGALLVPMRHWRTNALAGAQVIRWLGDERRYEKKMLPGMRAKGAVLRLGSPQATRTWLVEGYATALSVEAALRLLKLRDSVTVCFSAGNLVHVAQQLPIEAVVFADNDASGAGERAAQAAMRPYCMSDVVGEDANDLHKRRGVFSLANVMVAAMRQEMAA